ncbi:MAG TPA: trypsin-like peptidase domain-containing protein [Ktedonobacterales bacterium]|nr:trypsin-like peptidase domain-containing protein [Ktedonobacterales bacterium]
MQDITRESGASIPSTTPAAIPPTDKVANQRTEATVSPNTSGSTPPPRNTERKLPIHPLWLAAIAAALFGLVFGVGAVAGSPSTSSATSSAPSGTTIEETTINTIQAVDPSVVQIQGRGGAAGGSVGSGEILTTSGYIVTNDHVVRGSSRLSVLLTDGRQISAQLIGEAPTEDLAVLKISASNLKPIAVGDSSQVQVGEYALAIGSPLGLEQSATSGIISALNRQANENVDGRVVTITGLIQTSAPINPGNSGGALVNLKGQLIGIPTLGAVEPSSGVAANGIGFAISSNRMQTIVSQLTGGAA